jgi:hypothetical protein
MGYKFQFVTLAGFHSLNHGMFQLAAAYRKRGMAAYAELQTAEFGSEAGGYTATKHQREARSRRAASMQSKCCAHDEGYRFMGSLNFVPRLLAVSVYWARWTLTCVVAHWWSQSHAPLRACIATCRHQGCAPGLVRLAPI